MHENRLLPATEVRVTVHPPPNSLPSARLIPKGKRRAVLCGFVPLVIVALTVLLFFGATGGILVIVAVAALAGLVTALVQRDKLRSRRLYSSGQDDWMSRVAFYVGPFNRTGLPEAASFERKHSVSNNPPQVRLLVTDDGFVSDREDTRRLR
jgi:hypothetical protein